MINNVTRVHLSMDAQIINTNFMKKLLGVGL